MTPSMLRELAEAKSARELAEDKPGTQHVQWWVHLLMASIHAMTEEQRERMALELSVVAVPSVTESSELCALRRFVRRVRAFVTDENLDGLQACFKVGNELDALDRYLRTIGKPVAEEPERGKVPWIRLPERDDFEEPDPGPEESRNTEAGKALCDIAYSETVRISAALLCLQMDITAKKALAREHMQWVKQPETERAPDPDPCSCEEAERMRKKVEQLRSNIEIERGTSRRLSAQIESLRELIAGWV